MEEKQILEGNKLIAEFLGYRVFNKRYPRNHGIGAPEAEWKDMIIDKAKYHSSWDWLMPVIEKISENYDVSISLNKSAIDVTTIARKDVYDGEISSMGGMSAIENTFISVIKFIEWYNTKSAFRKN